MSCFRKLNSRILTCSILPLSLLLLALVSCSTGNLKAPVAEFAAQAAAGVEEITFYYQELNEYERQLYLEERALDAKLEVLKVDEQGKPTPLFDKPFDPRAIQARVRLLNELQNYTTQLASLSAGGDEKRFKTEVAKLTSNLTNVKDRFDQLSSGESAPDADAKKFLNPIGTIVGIIGEAILEKKRSDAVKDIIIKSSEPVNQAFEFLEKDMQKFIDATRRTGQRLQLAEWVSYYNENREKMTLEERKATLTYIRQLVNETDLVTQASPSQIATALKNAHLALVEAAKAPGSTATGSFWALFESYQEEIKELVGAIQELRALRERREQ